MKNKFKYMWMTAVWVSVCPAAWAVMPSDSVQVQSVDSIKMKYYVKGCVTDAVSGEPLLGVSVASMPGISALTDEKGYYRVPVASYDGQLTFSSPGYVPRTISLRGQRSKDMVMYTEAFRSEKSGDDVWGCSTSFSVDEEIGMRFGGDVRAISRGDLPGLGANMFIRGYHSVNLNSQPLVVIDGVIQNTENVESVFSGFYINALANIDINDVEKVEILKNATSLYGSKGANGAILITTKRGRSIATKIDLNMNWAFNFRPKMPKMMDGEQYRSYASELIKGSMGNDAADRFDGFLNDDPDLSSNITYNQYHNNHDWLDDVCQTGIRQYYGLNVEGGDDVAKYALSIAYAMGRGQVKTTDHDRLTTRFNADIVLAKRLTLAAGFDFSHLTRNVLDDGVNDYTSPVHLALIKSPLVLPYQFTSDGVNYTSNLSEVDVFGVSNPQSLLDNAKGKFTQYRFGVNVQPKWNINDMFDLSSRFAYSMNAVKEHYYSPIEGIAPQVQEDGTVYENTVKDQSINQDQLFSDTRFHFNHTFGGRHELDASLGLRIQTNTYKSNYGEGHNTGSDKIVNLNTNLVGKVIDGRKTTLRNSAMYLSAAYSYDQRYGVWGTLTEEACNSFGREASDGFRFLGGTWATFPSAGVNWLVSGERFMQSVGWIDRLNLRAEIGWSGNDGLDVLYRYAYLNPVNYFGNANGLQIANLGNERLKWETVRKINAGIDLSFLHDRLGISIDYFKHHVSDMLMYRAADILTGLDSYLANGGEMENEGIELNLSAKIVNRSRFKWSAELGFTHYKNKVLSVPGGFIENSVGKGNVLVAEGQPLGVFYGYRTVSENGSTVFQTERQAMASGLQTWNETKSKKLDFHAGDVHFADLDRNGLIDEKDRTVIGDPNPALTGSFMNRMSMGLFMLEFFFTYSLGNDIYNYRRHLLEQGGTLNNQTLAMAGRWRYDGQVTDMPRAVYGDPMGNARFSDRFVEDGSYLRLKDVKLSYELPIRIKFIHGATAWVSASNLYTWTKYLGADPEVSYGTSPLVQGVDYGILSGGRSFQFGIKLNL